jgi:hypothetical protein
MKNTHSRRNHVAIACYIHRAGFAPQLEMVGRFLLLGLQGLSTVREEMGCGTGGDNSASGAWWMRCV